jgi:uncharacterized protein YbaR (Trm112 family)
MAAAAWGLLAAFAPPLKMVAESSTLVGVQAKSRPGLFGGGVSAMRKDLLGVLRCPEDRSALTPADPALLSRLNAAIRAGRLRNRRGRQVEQTLDGGLVRAAGDLLYPIVDEIPVLLLDEAIPLNQAR